MRALLQVVLFFMFLTLPLAGAALSSSLKALQHVKADKWNVVGGNYIISGNVRINYKDIIITCDQAIINQNLRDFEAKGNCRMVRWKVINKNLTVKELAALEKCSDVKVEVTGISGNVFGERKLSVRVDYIAEAVNCHSLSGNMKSGYFRFDKLRLNTRSVVCRAESGERLPNGVLELVSAEVSPCSYLKSDNAHISVGASKLRLIPHRTGFFGAEHIDRDFDDHIITMWHGIAKVYGMPVFYFPYIFKPRDEDPGFFGFHWGKSGDWGYFFSAYKRFVFTDYPLSKLKVRADWYTLRGVGYGAEGTFQTENSRTDVFAYGLYDIRPYESDNYDDFRIKIPHARFDLRVSNITHLTPYLDFRGAIEYASDPYFVRDFFNSRYNSDPEPATFAALEQQFDNFTASAYFRFQIMDSFTTVEKIPELNLIGQRQQIFNTPFYYQGDMTTGYYQMKWIEFDKHLQGYQGSKLKDYDAFRFDTTHFLYLPLRTPYFVFTPRAGFKLTAYSASSETKVSEEDLLNMFTAAAPTNRLGTDFKNYDDDGGSKVRWVGELGAELSTKIHNTWSDLRSTALRLDGLRHIIRPYANYTFISTPNEGRKQLYYFDEIDRIEGTSFFRFGLENRLQTRDGNGIKNWLRLENFIDVYTTRKDGMNYVGDFCTLLSVTPVKGLTVSTQIMMDAGNNNEKMPDDYRHGRNVGRTGIDLKWLNRWNVSVKYTPVEDVTFTFAYDYMRPYSGRYAYSMGSTLTMLESSRWFKKTWYKHTETFSVGIQFPITPDRRTFAGFAMGYDFIDGHVSMYKMMLKRVFHCIELNAVLAFEYDSDDSKKNWDTSFSVGARFTGLDSPVLHGANAVLADAKNNSKGFSL
ncbi:MAG: LPS-assembly protein LptD [Lentisphaeria bacterium]|nr:LPS-assembly protein LptD [Lentisphaeria bacterium]